MTDKTNEDIARGLVLEMEKMPVIDAHEHLPFEEVLIKQPADIFTRIYCHYSMTSAISAGMPPEYYQKLKSPSILLDERWRMFAPFQKGMKETGYARAAQITARNLYGIDDIDDESYRELSDKLQETNRPGLYEKVLKNKCGIERVLNQGSWNDGADGFSVPVSRDFLFPETISHKKLQELYQRDKTANGGNFSSACDWVRFKLGLIVEQGAVGLKFAASIPMDPVRDSEAETLYGKSLKTPLSPSETSEETIRMALRKHTVS